MDKFGAMKAFVRVVEAGTFTKAAESLGYPKPQVTRLVQALEQELATLLLNRTTRRVTLTAEGAAYYDRAVNLLDDLEELESGLARAQASPRGRLRVDMPTQLASLVVVPALEDFCTRYPEIHLDIGSSDATVDLIAENVDCVLRAGEVTDPSLVVRRIAALRRIVVAAPRYLERFGEPQHPADLEGERHRIVSYFSRGSERLTYVMERGAERYEARTRSIVSVNDAGTMLAAGIAGLGIARTSLFMAAPYLAAGTLRIVLPEWSAGAIPVYVVYPPNRHVSARLRAFIDWCVELFARSFEAL
jgi:DNA-binding transcriptional LysR family regulator